MITSSTLHTKNKNPSVLSAMVFVLSMLMISAVYAESSDDEVVLIAARGSGIEAMQLRDIRRVYLGFKSADNKSVKNPVLNVQSKALYDEFLKNTMHLTEGSYKRKLVKRMFRQGSGEILEVKSLEELNKHLQDNIGDISFIETDSIENMDNVEVIQVLW